MSTRNSEDPHLGTTLTGAAVLFVLLRLLAVAHYDWHTTFALLHTLDLEDAPGLFLGTFMADQRISSVLLVLVVPLMAFYIAGTRSRTGAMLLATVLVAFLVAHVLTYHHWWVPVAAGVLAVVLGGIALRHRDNEPGPAKFVVRRIGWIIGGLALVVAAVVATPWVPRERIETTDGTIEAYVVETSPGFLKVLVAEDREFRILRDDDVRSRVELKEH